MKKINYDRRNFLSNAIMAIGASELAILGLTNSFFTDNNKRQATSNNYDDRKSFDSIKQINAGLLNVGYAEAGPTNGSPVILLHGWPYDINTYSDVLPLLAQK